MAGVAQPPIDDRPAADRRMGSGGLPDRRANLLADCGRCVGLCCVALPFAVSADFAMEKSAGVPCPNLGGDFGCGIHASLSEHGFGGCTVFDCFGAGQQVSQVTYAGRDWRTDAATAAGMFRAFAVMRQLHEFLFYLAEALTRGPAEAIHPRLRQIAAETERLAGSDASTILNADLPAHRARVDALLRQVSTLVRSTAAGSRPDRSRRDLIGADLRAVDLRGADLRGALLIGADLRGADLGSADLIGADLRAADLRGADLTESLFLTWSQLNAARGDRSTRFPDILGRPEHWVDP